MKNGREISGLDGAQGRNRTTDTRIFNPLLYQLSYLGVRSRFRPSAFYRDGQTRCPSPSVCFRARARDRGSACQLVCPTPIVETGRANSQNNSALRTDSPAAGSELAQPVTRSLLGFGEIR